MGFDQRDLYYLFDDLGQENVYWQSVIQCPNMRAAGGEHAIDCDICGGNQEVFIGDPVEAQAPMMDQVSTLNELGLPVGRLMSGEVVLVVPAILPVSGSWINNPLMKVRQFDRILASEQLVYGSCTTSAMSDWILSDISTDAGTVLTKVYGSVDVAGVDTLTSFVIDTLSLIHI
jgi:hypothetical protein